MTAEATLTVSKGGNIADAQTMKQALESAGVKSGASNKAIENFLGRQFETQAGEIYSCIVAHGKRAKNGTDTRYIRLCATAQDRVLSPQKKKMAK